MDPTVQSALITGIATLVGVALGALPTYLIARSQHRMELERQKLQWRKEYREKLLEKVERMLELFALGEPVPSGREMVGVFDPSLAEIIQSLMRSDSRNRNESNNELLVKAHKRMEELIAGID
jgi:hypothetical protein